MLIRWRAWWFNKVPLSITAMLLLLDGRPASLAGALALVLLVLTVCAVGNYGYAINDLYDIDEDARAGRANAAASLGERRAQAVVVGSAVVAMLFGGLAAGMAGIVATLPAIALPFVYSRPPWRIKERKWLGIAADALAAHVYPAGLALLCAVHWQLRPVPSLLVAGVLAWSAAAGVRGILSHQLHTAERDRQGGLTTVVHDHGAPRLEGFVAFVLLPIEVAGFVAAVIACDGGPILWAFGGLYLACEAFKTKAGGFRTAALRPGGQPYIPFVEESFYKAWGSLVIALDAARVDWRFLAFVPLYALLFRPHLRNEAFRLRAVAAAIVEARRIR